MLLFGLALPTFVIKTVNTVYACALVIASQNKEVFGIFDLHCLSFSSLSMELHATDVPCKLIISRWFPVIVFLYPRNLPETGSLLLVESLHIQKAVTSRSTVHVYPLDYGANVNHASRKPDVHTTNFYRSL